MELRIHEMDRLSEDVVRLLLCPRAGRTMSYLPGQFLSVLLPDGDSRCYSMAGPCREDGRIELHVRLQPGGRFSSMLANDLRAGDCLTVTGPFGACVLQPDLAPYSSVVMLATGTGIAPLKAMIEHSLAAGRRTPITLYWGGLKKRDLYASPYFTGIEQRHLRFAFVPVLAEADEGWAGRRGFVQYAVAEDFRNLSNSLVYACGNPAMVDAARTLLTGARGLPPANFLADAFASPPPAGPLIPSAAAGELRISASLPDGSETELRTTAGTTLLSALKAAALPIRSVCGGKKACGTCCVEVDSAWLDRLPPPDRDESRLLASLDVSPARSRLACQIVLGPELDGLGLAIPADLP